MNFTFSMIALLASCNSYESSITDGNYEYNAHTPTIISDAWEDEDGDVHIQTIVSDGQTSYEVYGTMTIGNEENELLFQMNYALYQGEVLLKTDISVIYNVTNQTYTFNRMSEQQSTSLHSIALILHDTPVGNAISKMSLENEFRSLSLRYSSKSALGECPSLWDIFTDCGAAAWNCLKNYPRRSLAFLMDLNPDLLMPLFSHGLLTGVSTEVLHVKILQSLGITTVITSGKIGSETEIEFINLNKT